MASDIKGIDPADLRGIERAIENIGNKIDTFGSMKEEQRHQETLKTQNLHHKELLRENKEFNEKILSKYGDLNKWTKWLAIATLVLMIGTIAIAILNFLSWNKNRELIDNQLELIDLQKKTLAPILPKLSVEPLNELKFLDSSFVRNDYDKDRHWVFMPVRIPLRLQNLGLTKTGSINILSFHPWLGVAGIHLDNIQGLDKTIEALRIYHKNCYEGSEEICDESVVSSGNHNLTLEINCLFCESKVQYQNLTICIWKNSSKECE